MLEMAGIGDGGGVLDVAAGGGGHSPSSAGWRC